MTSNQSNADLAVLYARVSSDLQSAASIEDQLRMCKERAAKEEWLVVGSYTDRGSLGRQPDPVLHPEAPAGRGPPVSSTSFSPSPSTARPETRRTSPTSKRADALPGGQDRDLFEGEVNKLHIGLKGTVGALYLKDRAIVSVATRPWRPQGDAPTVDLGALH